MTGNSNKPKRSLGNLRRVQEKTKPKAPGMIGDFVLQRHTYETIAEIFRMTGKKVVTCGIAAWQNRDENGGYLTVEISPPYKHPAQTPEPDILDEMFGNDDDQRKLKMR
jgi:hypothetical protein